MIKVIQLLIIVLLFSYPGLSEANDNYKTFSKVDPSIPLINLSLISSEKGILFINSSGKLNFW